MSVVVRPYRRGGWEVDITFRLPTGRDSGNARPALSKSAAQRWAEDRERYLLQHGPPKPHKEVPTLEVRAEIRRRSRAGEPSQAERHCRHRIHPEMASGSHARREASRRDHERTGAAAEAGAGRARTEDREQRVDGVEHAAEEGGGMGRARAAAVHDQVVAESQEDDGVSRLRSSTSGCRRSRGSAGRTRT